MRVQGHEDHGPDANEYYQKVKTAQTWRFGAAIHSLEPDGLAKDLRMFKAEGVLLPADVCQALVAKAAAGQISEGKWEDLLNTLLPFSSGSETSFDSEVQKLGDLPRVRQYKLQAFTKHMFGKIVNPMIFDGQGSKSKLLEFSAIGVQRLEDEDAIMMDKLSAAYLEECRLIFCGLNAIIQKPFSASPIEAVKALRGQSSSIECKGGPFGEGPIGIGHSGLVQRSGQ